jgi:hypothetical protein
VTRRRTIAERDRDFQAVDLHRRGLSYRQIATQLGYKSHVSVGAAITRALAEQQGPAVEEARKVEEDKLDDLTRVQWRILGQRFIAVSNGRVMLHPVTDEPMEDVGPHQQATALLLRIAERRAKLRGLDQPARVEVRTLDEIDARLIELADQVG